jgi:tRNA threonylcarbamoyladenosine biosynthesis protein TsaB
MAEELLSEAGIGYNQLNLIAFGRGPGSFTGVRIATACAQGMALGLDIPVLGISSLATLAQALREQAFQAGGGIIHAALDARMGEIYYGRFLVDETRA